MQQPLLCLVGPTGGGKTAVALELCDSLDGEIISADSVQIYRGLNIGSAKPTREEQARARHHLIDIREPHETYSAALWARDAHAAIAEISSRGKTPIVVGGTGFYLRALLQPNLIPAAPPDEKLRAELAREYSQNGADFVFQKLRDLDVNAAARLHPNDAHRVMRAIEIALAAQKNDARVLAPESVAPEKALRDFRDENTKVSSGEENAAAEIASTREPVPEKESEFAPLVCGLQWSRTELYARLEKRIEAMLQNGFLEELRALLESGVSPNAPSLQSVGYKQMQPALHDQTLFRECVELWKRDTRRYAKRQMTWFRHQLPTRWIDVNEESDAAKIAEEIAREYSREIAP